MSLSITSSLSDDISEKDGSFGRRPSLLDSEDGEDGGLSVLDNYNPQDLVTSWTEPALEEKEGGGLSVIDKYNPQDLVRSWTEPALEEKEYDGVHSYQDEPLPTKKRGGNRFFIYFTVAVLVIVIIVAVVTIAVVASGGSNGSSEGTPTPGVGAPEPGAPKPTSPTMAPSTQQPTIVTQDNLLEFLAEVSFDSGTALSNTTSPQFLAFSWLVSDENLETYSNTRKVQRYVLSTLYFSTNGDQWKRNDLWLTNSSECEWEYPKSENVPCSPGGQLNAIEISNNRLDGTLPDEIALLSNLIYLRLDQNQIRGTLATEIGLLSALKILEIRDNELGGELPSELGNLNSIEELDISENNLMGSVPPTFCEMNLTTIEVDCSDVFCTCCDESCLQEYLAALSTDSGKAIWKGNSPQNQALEWLSLDPSLIEYRPQQVVQRYALSTLYYSTNGDEWHDSRGYLTYDQNECLWGSQDTQRLSIANVLASSVEKDYRARNAVDNNSTSRWASERSDPQWIVLDLGDTHELDSVHLNWETASASEYRIDVSDNGNDWTTVFTETTGAGGLEIVQLGGVSGRYLRVYGKKRNTSYGYSLYEISVHGVLRSETCDANLSLKRVSLSANNLQGTIPPELALLSDYLETLVLSINQLSSTIPTEIGLLTSLRILDLSHNSLTSTIPTELGSMESLEFLWLNQNDLEGNLPSELRLLANLKTMVVDENSLTGDVPPGVCHLNLLELRVDCLEVNCTCCETCAGRANDGG